jgi:anti-sigma factor RsiW
MRESLGDFVDKPSLEESLRALAARRRTGENHPAPEELVAYRAGDLTAEEDDHIQEHLTQCRDCARLLLDLAEFEQLTTPPEELGPVDARAEASWQRLRSRLREDEEPTMEPPILQHRPRPRVPLWRRPALPWALAAGLTLCVAGLGWRTGSLERQLAEVTRPQAVRVVTLVSEEDITRGAGDEAPVRAGEGVAYNLLLPSDPEAPTYPLYAVKIVPATGEAPIPVGRQPADEGSLKVVLRAAPDPGDYIFEISGIAREREAPVGRYPFKVVPAR